MAVSEKRRKALILLAMASTTSLIFLNTTLLPIALPTIQRELLIPVVELQWIINAYLLATAVFVTAGGRLADLFGHRRLFCLGMAVYAIASVMSSLGQTGWWLIMSRAIQGTGGAMMSPAGMSIIIHSFPERERGRAIGIIVAIGSLFLSLGPFIGGAFTQYLSWRWAFLINPPIALFGIILILKIIPKSKTLSESFDFLGFFTLSSGIFCLTLGLMQGKVWGWSSWKVVFLFLLALCFFIAVRGFERLARHPFFQFLLFKNRVFFGGSILMLCTQFILMITVFWPLYFQRILIDSPMIAGLITAIGTIPLMLFSPLSGNLADKRGARFPIAMGFICLICCFLWFAYFLRYQNIPLLFPALFAFGTGISMVMTPVGSVTLGSVPPTKTGVATGMYNTLRFTGATIGVAVLGAVQVNVQDGLFANKLRTSSDTVSLNPSLYEGLLNNLPAAVEAAQELPSATLNYVQNSLIEASTFAFSITNLVTGAVAFLSLLITLIFFKKKR